MNFGDGDAVRFALPIRLSRRLFLASLATAYAAESSGRGTVLRTVAARYVDPATESVVLRLTDPEIPASLPVIGNRCASAKGFLYGLSVGGTWQGYWMDLKKRDSRQLTEATALNPQSLALGPGDKVFWYVDGAQVLESALTNFKKTKEVYRAANGWEIDTPPVFSEDGTRGALVEKGSKGYRLRVLEVAHGGASTVVEGPARISDPLPRPRGSALIYREGSRLRMLDFDGRNARVPTVAEGEVLDARWSGSGTSLLYLNRPADPRQLTKLREWSPETGKDTLIANTTQYVRFTANADATVFAGASGSKASPYLLLLLRGGRELTLAEHRAGDPQLAAPVFSPNSQHMLFQSDRHGKPAIYWLDLEKLVSETNAGEVSR